MNKPSNTQFDEAALRRAGRSDGVTHFASGLVVEQAGKVLVLRRAADDFLGGNYELPGGGVEADESFAEAAARELLEETGLKVSGIRRVMEGFDYEMPGKPKVRQLTFWVDTVPGEVRLSDEHDDYRWISPDEIADLPMSPEMADCLLRVFGVVSKR